MSKRYKNIHFTLSALKFILGLVILVLVALYIDPFQDPQTGVLIGSIGLLFLIWGGVYFVFYYAGLWRSDKKTHLISRFAYRASLLVAVYLLSNILLLVLELRNPTNGLIVLAIFALIYGFLFHRPEQVTSHASIDMIINEPQKTDPIKQVQTQPQIMKKTKSKPKTLSEEDSTIKVPSKSSKEKIKESADSENSEHVDNAE